ncbi:MAG: hypothetical protein ACRCWM_05075 [Sarcina sp.]
MLSGNLMMAVVRVRNLTGEKIENISLMADGMGSASVLKNIKSNGEKQTSVPSRETVKNLRMAIEGTEKSYLIKEEVTRGCMDKILVTIKNIREQECEYTVENVEY